jgi:hypothetical protein
MGSIGGIDPGMSSNLVGEMLGGGGTYWVPGGAKAFAARGNSDNRRLKSRALRAARREIVELGGLKNVRKELSHLTRKSRLGLMLLGVSVPVGAWGLYEVEQPRTAAVSTRMFSKELPSNVGGLPNAQDPASGSAK